MVLLPWILALISVVSSAASAKQFDDYRAVPGPTGLIEDRDSWRPECGRQTRIYVIQLRVKDLPLAAKKLFRIQQRFHAEGLLPGCSYYTRKFKSLKPNDQQLLETSWIDMDDLDRITQSVVSLGSIQYIGKRGPVGSATSETVQQLADWKARSHKSEIPAAEEGVQQERLRELESAVAAFQRTEKKTLLSVVLMAQPGVRTASPEYIPVSTQAEAEVKVTSKALVDLKAMLGDKDPHRRRRAATELMRSAELSADIPKRTAGIGINLSFDLGMPSIGGVIEGMPAVKVGIRAGDVLTAIGGTSTMTIEPKDLPGRIRGDEGTSLDLEVFRMETWETLRFQVTRKLLVTDREELLDLLCHALRSRDREVRIRSLKAIGKLRKSAAGRRREISDALSDPDPEVASAALETLQHLLGSENLPSWDR